MKTEKAFNQIMESSLFRLDGREIDLCNSLIDLCNAIEDEEETDWNLGECLECDLASLLIGAYWALTEWHGGQWSNEYAALSSIGSIYSPNYANGPEPESSEESAYEMICDHFKALNLKETR